VPFAGSIPAPRPMRTIRKIIGSLKLLKAYLQWLFRYHKIKKKIWEKIEEEIKKAEKN